MLDMDLRELALCSTISFPAMHYRKEEYIVYAVSVLLPYVITAYMHEYRMQIYH